MKSMSIVLIVVILAIAIALFFDFTNGFNDSANQVATVIASNALSPVTALVIAAIGNFVGAVFLGRAVAETLGKGIVDPKLFETGVSGVTVVIAALIGATLWNLTTWHFGLPSSSSHALVGGLVGAFVAGWGFYSINWMKVADIFLILLASPIVGFILSWLLTRLTFSVSRIATPKANRVFNRLQIISLVAQSLSHGTNDAQKTMGVITFMLIIVGFYSAPAGGQAFVPLWVVILCSLAISLGTLTGGWKIIKKLGAGLYKIRPIHAFSSQITSALIIYATSLFGFPISTTQVISSAVMGAGAATRPNMVRWLVARDILLAWLVTIPVSAVIATLIFFAIRLIF